MNVWDEHDRHDEDLEERRLDQSRRRRRRTLWIGALFAGLVPVTGALAATGHLSGVVSAAEAGWASASELTAQAFAPAEEEGRADIVPVPAEPVDGPAAVAERPPLQLGDEPPPAPEGAPVANAERAAIVVEEIDVNDLPPVEGELSALALEIARVEANLTPAEIAEEEAEDAAGEAEEAEALAEAEAEAAVVAEAETVAEEAPTTTVAVAPTTNRRTAARTSSRTTSRSTASRSTTSRSTASRSTASRTASRTTTASRTSTSTRSSSSSSSTPAADRPTGNAGAHVVATALRMIREGTIVRGSCFDYIHAVFTEAGISRRDVRTIYRRNPNGPYADISTIRPGDWLFIVNHPDRTPVGVHSVLFLGWEDRARGQARVSNYVGRRANRPGDIRTYDVTRTYGIYRPTFGR